MSMNYDAQEHEVMDYYAQAHMEQVFEHFVDDVNAKVEARFGLSIADFPDFDFYNYAPEEVAYRGGEWKTMVEEAFQDFCHEQESDSSNYFLA